MEEYLQDIFTDSIVDVTAIILHKDVDAIFTNYNEHLVLENAVTNPVRRSWNRVLVMYDLCI